MNMAKIEVRTCAGGDPESIGKYALYGVDDRDQEFGISYPDAEALVHVLLDLVGQVVHLMKGGVLSYEQSRLSASRSCTGDLS
jgi:hypothetical protein